MGVCRDGVEHQSVHCTCLQVNVRVVCVCVHMAACTEMECAQGFVRM